MGHVLEPLLHDLAERFRFLEEELGKMVVPPEAEASRRQIHQIAAKAKKRVDAVLSDPDVSRPEFAKNFYHTYKRLSELAQAIEQGTARVVERGDRVTGYTTHLAFFGHSTAETNVDLQSLIASAESFAGPGILVPSRNHVLLRWCLANGLRVVQPLTLMSAGLYSDPSGAWLPSVLF